MTKNNVITPAILCKIRTREMREKNLWTAGSKAAIVKVQTVLFLLVVLGISTHSHEHHSNNESGFLIWPLVRAPDTYYNVFYNLYSATLLFFI